MKTRFLVAIVFAVATLVIGVGRGQAQYSIPWFSIDAGGGTSAGGGYSLTGTIGQADAGKMSGGNYELTGGFMSIVMAIQTPGAPALAVIRNGNTIVVSWPENSTGFTLQETTSLATPSASTVWNDTASTPSAVDGKLQISVPAPVGNRFYRLSRP